MTDTEVWGLVYDTAHWDCGGWTIDGRDGVLVCACGVILREPEEARS